MKASAPKKSASGRTENGGVASENGGDRSPFKPKPSRSFLSQLQSSSTTSSFSRPIPRTKSSGDLRDANLSDVVHHDFNGSATGPESAKKKKNVHDRFIPNRQAMDVSTSQYALTHDSDADLTASSTSSLQQMAYQQDIARAHGLDPSKTRILSFNAAPPSHDRTAEDLKRLYAAAKTPSMAPLQRRRVITSPERVLDAPGLMDDYYLNLLDWSAENQVAIGLGSGVYLWNADTGDVNPLCQLSEEEDYVASVKFSQDAAFAAVGTSDGTVQIYDVESCSRVRTMRRVDGIRVAAVAWSEHVLASGAKDGSIWLHDVRVAEHKVAELVGHSAEVCGLAFRSDGTQLASGGNDNLVHIWEPRASPTDGIITPLYQRANHTAAVKALAWCPWQINLLATGGGTHDRHIHFWNTHTGALLHSIDAESQVTALIWSPPQYRELLSAHGFPGYQLTLWTYPGLQKVIEVPAHETRVLHACSDGLGREIVATAASDENLKFWKVWEARKGEDKKTSKTESSVSQSTAPAPRSKSSSSARPRSVIR